MGRDKARDDKHFSCSDEHELDYVARHYTKKDEVLQFLKDKCADNTIHYSTHKEVHELIESELGYSIPIDNE